jgi:arylsulfatase A-like enzyme
MFRTRPPQDWVETAGRCGNPDFNRMKLTRGQVQFLSDQYDAGIRAADDQLAEFFAFLEDRDELADTVLVVLSDHGEEFAEHGQIGHGETLFIEVLKVPLIVVAPGLGPRTVSQHVSLADVMPTLLDLLEIAAPAMTGDPLASLVKGDGSWARTDVFSELDRKVQLRSVLRGRDHLVMNVTRDRA